MGQMLAKVRGSTYWNNNKNSVGLTSLDNLIMASGYTPMSPDRGEKGQKRLEKSQQPEDPDDEDILTSKCPIGVDDDSVRTFIFKNQGHTLGNVLRDQLIKYPQVHFCGYSIPHPGENVMHLRIQTVPGSGISAVEMLRKALEDIMEVCDHIDGLFKQEMAKKEYAVS